MKNEYHIHPFYFPTTAVFVDDSTDFLANLSLRLPPALAFRLYDSPTDALAVLNGATNATTPVARFFSRYHHTGDLPLTHHVLDLNLDKIHREVHNEFRFEQISVAVVDYDMPSMNGIEFCGKIRNPAIKKVLLTGKADEKIAVQAFNQGVIDRFIRKQDNDVFDALNQAVADLQHDYFRQTERMLADALAVGKYAFLRDPLFAERFQDICRTLNIVEFYLCSMPDGMLMLNADGAASLLLIPNEDERLSQYEIAYEQGAPQELLDALKSNKVLPYFWKTGGHYYAECEQTWRDFMFPATEFKGAQWYIYAIVGNPPTHRTNTVLSYHEFLDELDQMGRKGGGQTSSDPPYRPPGF